MDGKKADATGQRFSVCRGKEAKEKIGRMTSRRKRILLVLKKGKGGSRTGMNYFGKPL